MEARHLTLKRLITLYSHGDCSEIVAFFSNKDLFDGNIRIGFRNRKVPLQLNDFLNQITWGQRMFFAQEPKGWLDATLRCFDGWFYPVLKNKPFDYDKCLSIGSKALNCNIDQLLPFAAHMIDLVEQMLIQEKEKTAGDVDKTWLAAGGSNLAKYGDLFTLNYLAPKLELMYGRKMGHKDVMDSPYLDCLVHLMERKETSEVEKEYHELTMLKAQNKQQ